MATISKIWSAEQQCYMTNYYSGSDADVAQTENLPQATDVNLETDGYEGAQCSIQAIPAGATFPDKLNVHIHGSINGTLYDTKTATVSHVLSSFIVDNPGSAIEARLTFIIKDLAHFKVGFQSSGATNTWDVKLLVRRWRWQSV